jgi:hypothetical protein
LVSAALLMTTVRRSDLALEMGISGTEISSSSSDMASSSGTNNDAEEDEEEEEEG